MESTNKEPRTQDFRRDMSPSIGKLAEALGKAQAKFPSIPKTKTVNVKTNSGQYSYQYAELADIIHLTRGILSENGLAITQTFASDALPMLITILAHSSGEWISSELPLFMTNQMRAQEIGSLLTYMRRYSFCAILSIASEEDEDGALASDAPKGKQPSPRLPDPPNKPFISPTDKNLQPNQWDAIKPKAGVAFLKVCPGDVLTKEWLTANGFNQGTKWPDFYFADDNKENRNKLEKAVGA